MDSEAAIQIAKNVTFVEDEDARVILCDCLDTGLVELTPIP